MKELFVVLFIIVVLLMGWAWMSATPAERAAVINGNYQTLYGK